VAQSPADNTLYLIVGREFLRFRMMTTLSYRVSITVLTIIAFMMLGIMIFAAFAAEHPSVIACSNPPAPQHQHYYPTTGVKPKIGRAEDSSAPSSAPEPPETYRRNY
jgi:hypothetical protein